MKTQAFNTKKTQTLTVSSDEPNGENSRSELNFLTSPMEIPPVQNDDGTTPDKISSTGIIFNSLCITIIFFTISCFSFHIQSA